jgi:hypothetical protein
MGIVMSFAGLLRSSSLEVLERWDFRSLDSLSRPGQAAAKRKFDARSALGSKKAEIKSAMQPIAKCQEVQA